MNRLYRKGLLSRISDGKAFRYWVRCSPDELQRRTAVSGLRQLLRTQDAGLHLSYFVEEVGQCDEKVLDELQTLVERQRAELLLYELKPSQGGWTESILHSFAGAGDGSYPAASLIFDQQGNLYGTARYGGDLSCNFSQGCGTVFELSPSGSEWKETTLYTFEVNDVGIDPEGGLVFDGSGNLFGTVPAGGTNRGTVYELQPSGGSWTASALEQFRGNGGPVAGLTMDASGNLYGTTAASGSYYHGSVFKMSKQGATWQLTTLHSFDVEGDEGDNLDSGVLLGANGNLFGTASQGGVGSCVHGCGVIWEITP